MYIRTNPNLIRNTCINKNKCRYCPNMEKSGKITSTTTGTTYSCKRNFTCKSSNLVYAITCRRCKNQYVGQTKRTILERFEGGYSNINKASRNPDQGPGTRANAHTNQLQGDAIGQNFAQSNHKSTRDLKIQTLEFISLPQSSERALELQARGAACKPGLGDLRIP